jgi:predicted  nucleic acid-binding Zn-ribbon protein
MVFSLSMLDVFCCALGCVTLLWLVNQREAMLRARDASGLTTTLATTRSNLAQVTSDFDAARIERARLDAALRRLRGELEAASARADELTKDLTAATKKSDDTADRLAKANSSIAVLTREAGAARDQVSDLESKLKDEEARFVAADRRANTLSDKLKDAQAANARLRSENEALPRLRAAAGETGDQLAASEVRVRSLEQELEAARRAFGGVDAEKKDLATRLARAQLAVENRFEGIALSGRRVVFLVDMSGSMELVDSNNLAPTKWNAVRDTLVKIFRSLPDLEKYQVILFSDQISYPLGNDARWLDPDPKAAERIQTALTAVKPKGNTNMYQALDAAFRFRPAGLDTIYLLSDGLPNVGEGLATDAAARMTEPQRSEVLARVIRGVLRTTWNPTVAGRPRVRVHSVGFFYESPDVGAFLWALSRENDGSFVGMSKP